MVYYSNYRVVDSKVFFGSTTWRVAEKDRGFLIGQNDELATATKVGGKSPEFFFESGKRKKNFILFA